MYPISETIAISNLRSSKATDRIIAKMRACKDMDELGYAWDLLTKYTTDRTNLRSVRVNAMQVLYEITTLAPELMLDFKLTVQELEKENIPSINARIGMIRKVMDRKAKKAKGN